MSDDRYRAADAFGAPRTSVGTPERADSRAVFGQTMGLVAVTTVFAALGCYLGRDLGRGAFWIALIVAFGCLFGLQAASARRNESLAVTLLFAFGLALGLTAGPAVNFYASTQPTAVYEAAGSTGIFVGGLGAYGYATSRDLSGYARGLFFALIALLVFGLVLMFVSIPGANIVYCVLGLAIFGGFTVIDFNRLRRAGIESAPSIAASIFLDIFNVFLFFLSLFGGGGRR